MICLQFHLNVGDPNDWVCIVIDSSDLGSGKFQQSSSHLGLPTVVGLLMWYGLPVSLAITLIAVPLEP